MYLFKNWVVIRTIQNKSKHIFYFEFDFPKNVHVHIYVHLQKVDPYPTQLNYNIFDFFGRFQKESNIKVDSSWEVKVHQWMQNEAKSSHTDRDERVIWNLPNLVQWYNTASVKKMYLYMCSKGNDSALWLPYESFWRHENDKKNYECANFRLVSMTMKTWSLFLHE